MGITIPEEKILQDLCVLLMDELPKTLLDIEEQTEDGIHLAPLRYAGSPKIFTPGTGFPHAFVEIEDATLTEKDRIIRNVIYTLKITMKLSDPDLLWRYFMGIEDVLKQTGIEETRTQVISKKQTGILMIRVITTRK